MAIDPSALLSAPDAASAAALLPASNAGGLGGLGGYINSTFQDLLGHAPSQDQVNYFTKMGSPSDIVGNIMGTPEYRQNQIKSMFQTYLGHDPNADQINYFMSPDKSLNDVANNLAGTDESKSYFANQPPQGPNLPQGPLVDPKQLWQATPWSNSGNSIDQLSNFLTQSFAAMGAKNPQAAAQAMLGSAAVESPGFNPTQKQDGGTGYGIWQLTGAQYNGAPNPANNVLNYLQFAKQNGYDPNSAEAQARYGIYALANNPTYSGANDPNKVKDHALQMLLSASDPTAALAGALKFESPGGYNPDDPTKTPSYNQRLANTIGLQTYQNGGGITEQQLNTFLKGGNNGIPANALPPGVMPNNISLSTPDQPYIMPDTRLDAANSGITQSVAANNTLLNGWSSDAANNLLNFNANSVFNGGGMITNPVFGSSGTLGQPNMFGGNGTNNMPPPLTIYGPGSSVGGGDGP